VVAALAWAVHGDLGHDGSQPAAGTAVWLAVVVQLDMAADRVANIVRLVVAAPGCHQLAGLSRCRALVEPDETAGLAGPDIVAEEARHIVAGLAGRRWPAPVLAADTGHPAVDRMAFVVAYI